MTYDLSGMLEGHRTNDFGRHELIFRIIEKNPRISQNHLKNIVCNQLKGMAKATFERQLKRMIEEGHIVFEEKGNKKLYYLSVAHEKVGNKRFYAVPVDFKGDNVIKTQIDLLLADINGSLIKTQKDFAKFPRIKQNTVALQLLKVLNDIQTCITMVNAATDHPEFRKEMLRIEKMIQQAHSFICKELNFTSWQFLYGFLQNQCLISNDQLKKYLENDSLYEVKQYFTK